MTTRGDGAAPGPRALFWDRPATAGHRLVAATCAVGGLLGLLVLVPGVVGERDAVTVLRERGLVAQATVTGAVSIRGASAAVVTFTTAAGEVVVVEGLVGARGSRVEEGARLAVVYDPLEPSVARTPGAVDDEEGRGALVTAAVLVPLTALQAVRALRPAAPRRAGAPTGGRGVRRPGAGPTAAGGSR